MESEEEEKLLDVLTKVIEKAGDNFDNLLAQARQKINTATLLFTVAGDIKPPYDGWKLENNSGNMPVGEVKFELASFLRGNESSISGNEMIKRAKEMGADFNQGTAEILLANQNRIPESWRKFYLVFPGTVWLGLIGECFVPCLRWHSGRWILYFYWFGIVWGADDRFLCLCN